MIRYDGVTLEHRGKPVLRDFDLEVDRGEKVLIYGRSGTGKTTVLRLLLGFEHPASGAVYFEGEKVDKRHVWEVRKRTAYVSQDLDVGEGLVREFIHSVLDFKTNRSLAREGDSLMSALDLLELDPAVLDKSMQEISGGEKQRVALATSMLLNRDVFLLDEATSAIDQGLKKKVVDYFVSLDTVTLIAASHDVNWLEPEAVRVVRLGED